MCVCKPNAKRIQFQIDKSPQKANSVPSGRPMRVKNKSIYPNPLGRETVESLQQYLEGSEPVLDYYKPCTLNTKGLNWKTVDEAIRNYATAKTEFEPRQFRVFTNFGIS